MGNCGVGFAPVVPRPRARADRADGRRRGHPRRRARRGHPWGWESFAEYMDALDAAAARHRLPRAGAARPAAHVRDGRARVAQRAPRRADDIAAMRALRARGARRRRGRVLAPGAATTTAPRAAPRRRHPRRRAPSSSGIAQAFDGLGARRDPGGQRLRHDARPRALRCRVRRCSSRSAAAARPAAVDRRRCSAIRAREQWRRSSRASSGGRARACRCACRSAARGIGVMHRARGDVPSVHGLPELQGDRAPAARRARRRACATRRARRASSPRSRTRSPATARRCRRSSTSCSRASSWSRCACSRSASAPTTSRRVTQSFLRARRSARREPRSRRCYDHLAEGDGSNLLYFPIYNYNDGSLDVVREMLDHPRALARPERRRRARRHGLRRELPDVHADALGARPRRGRAAARARGPDAERAQRALPRARTIAATIEVGLRADLNVIDPQRLARRRADAGARPARRRPALPAARASATSAPGSPASRCSATASSPTARPGRLVRAGR